MVTMGFISKANFPINLCGGVGDFKIDETTFREVRSIYPNVELKKYWEEAEWIFIGNFVKVLVFNDLGVEFFFRKKNRLGKHYLFLIRMGGKFNGKTPGGNGIGSNYNDLVKEFGEQHSSRILGYNSNGRTYYSVNHSLNSGADCWLNITFSCYSVRNPDKSNFIVEGMYID